MVFSSVIFLFVFLPLVIAAYYIINPRYRNIWLLFASLFFYSWGEPKNILVMLLSIVFNYFAAILIHKFQKRSLLQTITLAISVLFNLGILAYFKYTDFFINNINFIFHADIKLLNIALPIGISFFTFQSLSYLIDVKREKVEVQKNILDLGLYISFFPQLIAGPIVRYIDINQQLQNRNIDIKKFNDGCIRFISGFSKKILIADQLAPYADAIFAQNGISSPSAWTGIIAYTLQIYFDFSGYSDMAIGLGKMFGFDFPENFDYPYISKSVKEFWRRWHISLSQWFRDYVYIPLGGSRHNAGRTYLNLFIVWILTGFWHGASWNFIFWGLYYFIFLILERGKWGRILEKLPRFFQHIYTILVFTFGWVFFRADGIMQALKYIRNLFCFSNTMWLDFINVVDRKCIFCILTGIVFAAPIMPLLKRKLEGKFEIVYTSLVFVTFLVAIAFLMGAGFSPFLYFRF